MTFLTTTLVFNKESSYWAGTVVINCNFSSMFSIVGLSILLTNLSFTCSIQIHKWKRDTNAKIINKKNVINTKGWFNLNRSWEHLNVGFYCDSAVLVSELFTVILAALDDYASHISWGEQWLEMCQAKKKLRQISLQIIYLDCRPCG